MKEQETLSVNARLEVERMMMARSLGLSFNGERDVYDACGYTKQISFENYFTKYDRNGLAATVVEAFPDACWRTIPSVYEVEDEGEQTNFEKQWKLLTENPSVGVFESLHRVDVLSGIGHYAILLLGFDDGGELSQPISGNNHRLIYTQVYHEGDAEILQWHDDPKKPEFGSPSKYKIKITSPTAGGKSERTADYEVHASRVIHVPSDRVIGRKCFGTPRMKRVYNQLDDIEKILGSGAEGWWRSAFQGLHFDVRDNAELSAAGAKEMDEEIKAYINNLQRYIRSKGVDVKPIAASAADPRGIVDVILDFVAIATRTPKRILTGTEQGELAGAKDQENWDSRVQERRRRQSEAKILLPFVNTLIRYGALPAVAEKVGRPQVDWKDESEMTALDRATLGKVQVETAAAYIQGGVEQIYPLDQFLGEIMGMDQDQIKEVRKQIEEAEVEEAEEEVVEETDEQEEVIV